ncbi:MAG: M23 family metallopeptidase [Rhodobiaceae bacterium]|jgi:murein DD-endopeptidase MepM/ murein hydrolase activator NlpD|nr:M23 family metallopeptidase [Rhodobiaceae bacterium]MBT5518758.1 M23 family metallopeptidase [Rhodobiaceae bacterium]MBT7280170.1 M23 family metallopeptidase [Rhodobiaceae bacterium]
MLKLASLFLLLFVALQVNVQARELSSDFVKSQSGKFSQGGLVVLQLTEGTKVSLNGAALPVVDNYTVLGFGRDAKLRQEIAFTRGKKSAHVPLTLTKRRYSIQRIDGLPPTMVTPPEAAMARIIAQGKLKRQARAGLRREADFSQSFRWPVKGRISGVYGSQRFYNGEPRRPHFGIDIAAPRGTQVVAPAPGKVTLAEPDMYFEGGLIFIDHGLKVISAYMHLDSLNVKVGDQVAAGDVIATVGSTGRSTGPHLDWRMFWGGARIDPALVVTGSPSR